MTGTVSIRREAAISVGINGALSLAFFLAVFGTQPRLLAWATPDRLALDFVPQSIAVALMSALVPALIARRRVGGALRPILLRAAGFALAGAALGGLLALATGGLPPIGWSAALAIKIAYGGALGALVASLALRRMLSSAPII
ncbi:hypothetical protein N5J77_13190 [Sphingobium yanoikuyae]|jgi:hypothetical protein|uniref:Uncharacterized protein n=1 Tax=Sphingobium yanoikuyae TaxID=13690 RepID=A0AA42WUR2_SPHYA|nr:MULTISPECIES: hypothetical protein [Sphingobium]MDH2132083.1 hypothetical protein [Sphingobium yanoikuyae]MDH2148366.1 hypothetical protein [Sphingobium yanoikuyae]MDH2167733.1 hypothetical protein [Sphingobium yanoikuyae]PZU66413.1 MAG: hypothetical protein DI540_14800 [Sphingobium sp.]